MTSAPLRILIVDDDPDIASVLQRGLRQMGFDPVVEHRLDAARARFGREHLDAAIVDVMLGADSGLDLVAGLRADGIRVPVLMLSALTGIEDRTAGLRAGADDYVVKPFVLDELAARLMVQISRAGDRARADLILDPGTRSVRAGPAEATLTEREFALLSLFLAHKGQTLPRGTIFDALWTGEGPGAENVVDVYVGYLRRKLSPSGAFGVEIVTIRSRGFQLREVAPPAGS